MAEEVKRGQVWKFGWMFVTVRKAGPKVIEVKSDYPGSEAFRVPRERFLQRFHLTGLGGNPEPDRDGDTMSEGPIKAWPETHDTGSGKTPAKPDVSGSEASHG